MFGRPSTSTTTNLSFIPCHICSWPSKIRPCPNPCLTEAFVPWNHLWLTCFVNSSTHTFISFRLLWPTPTWPQLTLTWSKNHPIIVLFQSIAEVQVVECKCKSLVMYCAYISSIVYNSLVWNFRIVLCFVCYEARLSFGSPTLESLSYYHAFVDFSLCTLVVVFNLYQWVILTRQFYTYMTSKLITFEFVNSYHHAISSMPWLYDVHPCLNTCYIIC